MCRCPTTFLQPMMAVTADCRQRSGCVVPSGNVMRFLIAVSGPIAVGKSAVIGELAQRFKTLRISTRELIQARRPVPSERGPLQAAGEALDRETDGKWVAEDVAARTGGLD